MIITNKKAAPALPGQGVKITIDPMEANDAECLSWIYPGMQVTSDSSGDTGYVTTIDRKGQSFVVVPFGKKFQGSSAYKFMPSDTISFNENKIGNFIWKLDNYDGTQLKDGTSLTIYNSGDVVGNVPAGLNPNNSSANVANYGYLYNGWSRAELLLPTGWRIPNEYDVQDLCTTAGGTAVSYPPYVRAGKIRQTGTTYWLNGTDAQNFKNFNSRGAGNGSVGNSIAATVGQFKNYNLIHFYPLSQSVTGYSGKVKAGWTSGMWVISGSDFSAFYSSNSTGTTTASNAAAYSIRLCRNLEPFSGIS